MQPAQAFRPPWARKHDVLRFLTLTRPFLFVSVNVSLSLPLFFTFVSLCQKHSPPSSLDRFRSQFASFHNFLVRSTIICGRCEHFTSTHSMIDKMMMVMMVVVDDGDDRFRFCFRFAIVAMLLSIFRCCQTDNYQKWMHSPTIAQQHQLHDVLWCLRQSVRVFRCSITKFYKLNIHCCILNVYSSLISNVCTWFNVNSSILMMTIAFAYSSIPVEIEEKTTQTHYLVRFNQRIYNYIMKFTYFIKIVRSKLNKANMVEELETLTGLNDGLGTSIHVILSRWCSCVWIHI